MSDYPEMTDKEFQDAILRSDMRGVDLPHKVYQTAMQQMLAELHGELERVQATSKRLPRKKRRALARAKRLEGGPETPMNIAYKRHQRLMKALTNG